MSEADVTGRLARYMAEARRRSLPPHVAREARHRILDTLAAMVSGSRLKPGEMAIRYARAQGGVAEAFRDLVVNVDRMRAATAVRDRRFAGRGCEVAADIGICVDIGHRDIQATRQ